MKRGTVTHAKTIMLADKLDLPHYAAVGLLECLFHFTASDAKQGNIGKYSDEVIAQKLYWPKEKAGLLLRSLCECGWIDKHRTQRYVVHDWSEHAEESVKKYLKYNNLEFYVGRKVSPEKSGESPEMSRDSRPALPSQALPSQASPEPEKPKEDDCVIPEGLNCQEFLDGWQEWIAYRKEIKKPLKATSMKSQLQMLSGHPPGIAAEMLRQSIRNQWQGIFEVKNDNSVHRRGIEGQNSNQANATGRGSFSEQKSSIGKTVQV